MHRNIRIAAVLAALFATPALAQQAKTIRIEAQDLSSALHSLASQTGIQLLFNANDLKGARTPGLAGALSAEEALRRLLEETKYTYTKSGGGTYVLRRKDAPAAPAPVLDEVVVTGARPAPVSLPLSGQRSKVTDSEWLGTPDTARLLDGQPGVSLWTGGGVSAIPALRGLQDDRVRILVDGTSITSACSNHMNTPLSYISPSQVEQISVFAGITPVSMGGDSIGGTISVEPAKPRFAAGEDELLKSGMLGASLHDNRNGKSAFASVTLASASNNLSYEAASAEAGSYARGGSGEIVRRTTYKVLNQSLTFAHRMAGGGIWKANLALQDRDHEGFPNQRMDLTGNDGLRFGLGLEDRHAWGSLSAKLYYHRTKHRMDMLPPPENSGHMLMLSKGKDMGYVVKAEIPLAAHTLRLGNEYHRHRLDDWWPMDFKDTLPSAFWPNIQGDYVAINNGKRDRLGTFAEMQTAWNERWTTLLGVRSDIVSMDTGPVQSYWTVASGWDTASPAFNAADRRKKDRNFDLTALARVAASDTSDYEFGLARKTHSPNMYERYGWEMQSMTNPGMGDGNNYKGDINLKPEVAYHLAFTADWHDAQKERWQVRAAPYRTRVRDYIYGRNVGNFLPWEPTAQLQYVNLNRATLYGIDVSGRTALGGGFALRGQIGYVRGRNDDTGEPLYHMMPLNARVGADYGAGRWDGSLDVIGVQGKTRIADSYFESKTPGYPGNLSCR